MYYTAENFKIGLVVSNDNGASWQHPTNSATEDFSVLQGQPNKWDQVLETVDVLKIGNEYWMYYTGYREGESDNVHVENYQVGLAISTDGGLSFIRHTSSVDAPIMPINFIDDTSLDRHAITSPTVVFDNNVFSMIYTGWNTSNNFTGADSGIRTLGATSTNGIDWTKRTNPVINFDDIPWTDNSIDESDVYLAPNGTWYFLFTAQEGIGLAIASDIFGPYTFFSEPLLVKKFAWELAEIVAPNVIIEEGILTTGAALKIWYTGIETDTFFPSVIGYAESPYPVETP